jgi:hypothetical protein
MTEICTWPSCGHTAKGQCQPNKPTGLITDETLVKIENGKETPWWVAKLLHDRAAEIVSLKAEVERRRGVLKEAVYDVTHLSPEELDGSHWARISAEWLQKARAALTPHT